MEIPSPKFLSHPEAGEVAAIMDQQIVDRLRNAGFVIVPLCPTKKMIEVGAPFCFSVPTGTVEASLSDAAECYQAMVQVGCL